MLEKVAAIKEKDLFLLDVVIFVKFYIYLQSPHLDVTKKLKEFYDRLLANHKPVKVVLVAVMRKLLGFMHALVKNNSFWNNNYVNP